MDRTGSPRHDTGRWGWWALSALLAVALAIDIAEGQPLKLLTSALLLAGSLVLAVGRAPRPPAATVAALLLFGTGALLVLFRAVAGML